MGSSTAMGMGEGDQIWPRNWEWDFAWETGQVAVTGTLLLDTGHWTLATGQLKQIDPIDWSTSRTKKNRQATFSGSRMR